VVDERPVPVVLYRVLAVAEPLNVPLHEEVISYPSTKGMLIESPKLQGYRFEHQRRPQRHGCRWGE